MHYNNWRIGDICTLKVTTGDGSNFYTIVGIEEYSATIKKITFNLFSDEEIKNMPLQSLGRPYGAELLLLALINLQTHSVGNRKD